MMKENIKDIDYPIWGNYKKKTVGYNQHTNSDGISFGYQLDSRHT